MEAVCQVTMPAVNVSPASKRHMKPVQPTSLEFGSGSGHAFHPLSCRQRTSPMKPVDGVKRGGQVWSLDFRSEAAASAEDSISNKADTDLMRKSIEKAVNGVHSNSVNGISIVSESVSGDAGNGEDTKEEQNTYSAVATQIKDVTAISVLGVPQNGSVNGTTVRRSSRIGSPNGHLFSGVAAHNESGNGTSINGGSILAKDNGIINGHTVNGIYVNGSAVNGVTVNGPANGFTKVSPANGSATLLPELGRLVNVPLQVPAGPGERTVDVDVEDSLVPLKKLTSTNTSGLLLDADQEKKKTRDVADQPLREETCTGLGIMKFLKGKHILVTGATGFLAKVMVEKILRVQPDVGQLYLLIQPQKNVTAENRLKNNVFKSQLFKVLRSIHGDDYEEFMTKKLTAVSGTISSDGLGIDNDIIGELSKKVEVIVNSAATTTFDERYDIALNINTQGPRRLLDFAKGCPNLQIFLHVSTAFVNGQREGRTPEKPFRMGDSIAKEMKRAESIPELHVAAELELCARTLRETEAEILVSSFSTEDKKQIVDKKMVELGMARAQLFGWQDTYVFSKAMGEMLLDSSREGIPVVVLRPSVVESTLAEPFPGWMEGIRMMDPIVLAYGKGQMTGFLADPRGVLDVIPADLVVNALLAAMTKHAQKPSLHVYQVASSVVNPMTFSILADVALELFTKDPMLDRAGKPIVVQRMLFVKSMQAFSLYMWFMYQLPLQLFGLSKFIPWMKKGKSSEKRNLILRKTLEQFKYLASIYKPYTFYAGRFDVENTEALSQELSEKELERFAFNVRAIDWADYLYNVHIPGLRNYVLKGRGTKN